jgi:hypothetical protein
MFRVGDQQLQSRHFAADGVKPKAVLLLAHRRAAAKTIADRPALWHERASPTTSRLGMRCLS